MATYTQWLVRFPEYKQIMWITGDEVALVEQVLSSEVSVRRDDQTDILWFDMKEDELVVVHDAIDQYSVDGRKRMVVVRTADKIKKWDHIIGWARERVVSAATLIMVSYENNPVTTESRFRPFVEKGRYVECNRPADLEEFVSKISNIKSLAVKSLIIRTGGNLGRLLNELEKLECFNVVITESMVCEYVTPSCAEQDFIDSLLFGNKKQAFEVSTSLMREDIPKVIGGLVYRLYQLASLLPYKGRKTDFKTLSERTSVPVFLLCTFLELCQTITIEKVVRWLLILAKADRLYKMGVGEVILSWVIQLW